MSNSITRRNFLGLVGGATAVASLGLVGCGGTSASGGSGNGGFSKASYVVATDTTFAPFEFTDDSGKFVGIDVDILAACAENLVLQRAQLVRRTGAERHARPRRREDPGRAPADA